jgi:hypothetical protein
MTINFEFRSGAVDQFGEECDAYLQCVNETCARPEGHGLFWFDREVLLSRNATLVLASAADGRDKRRFAGGLHFTLAEGGGIYIQGAVVDQAFRGRGLLKQLAARARLLSGEVPASAVVRVYPDDRVNLASLLSLSAVGVSRVVGVKSGRYQGNRFDGHLRATLEPDGRSFRYLTLHGDASLAEARGILAAYDALSNAAEFHATFQLRAGKTR